MSIYLKTICAASISVSMTVGGLTTNANAVTVLRLGDSLPETHQFTQALTKPWMERVEELSNGEIKIKHYPAQQAGKAKDMLRLVQTGVLDIAYVVPDYVSDKMPLTGAAEMPRDDTTSCSVTSAYWDLVQPGGFYREHEFDPQGVKVLYLGSQPPYGLQFSSPDIKKLSDVTGKRIRSSGFAQGVLVKALDAASIQMPAPEIYDAMSRGTLDGGFAPWASMEPYKLDEVTHSVIDGYQFSTLIVTFAMSNKKWDSLPEDVREILAKAGEEVTKDGCKIIDKLEEEARERLMKRGIAEHKLSDEDLLQLSNIEKEVKSNWAEKVDATGKPGSEAVKAFDEALMQNK